jgi:hypothetical protein
LKWVAFLAAAAMCLPSSVLAAEEDFWNGIPWKIDREAARHLAAEAVQNGFHDHDFDDGNDQTKPPFLLFEVFLPPPATWGMYGFFSVNPWTGDVWALWGCNRLSTPAVRKLQAEIRRRFSVREAEDYARLRRLKPDCIYEDTPQTRGSPALGLAGVIRDIGATPARDPGKK